MATITKRVTDRVCLDDIDLVGDLLSEVGWEVLTAGEDEGIIVVGVVGELDGDLVGFDVVGDAEGDAEKDPALNTKAEPLK